MLGLLTLLRIQNCVFAKKVLSNPPRPERQQHCPLTPQKLSCIIFYASLQISTSGCPGS